MEIRSEYLPATGAALQELVLLHGWGCTREIWRPLLAAIRPWSNVALMDLPGCAPVPGGDPASLEDLLHSLIQNAPESGVYVGWSLGGQVALELAATFPDSVDGLITVCSNPRFVATAAWPGVEPAVFESFRQQYTEDPGAALKRFDSLQSGGAVRARPLLRQLRAMRAGAPGRPSSRSPFRWLSSCTGAGNNCVIYARSITGHTETFC